MSTSIRAKKTRNEVNHPLTNITADEIKMNVKRGVNRFHSLQSVSAIKYRSLAMRGNDHLFLDLDTGRNNLRGDGVGIISAVSSPVLGSTVLLGSFFVLRTGTLGRSSLFVSPAVAGDSILQPRYHAVRRVFMPHVVHLERAAQALFDAFGAFRLFSTAPDEDAGEDAAAKG